MILLKRLFLDQRGDIHLFTVFMTLFFFMFISIASTWVGIGANVMHIRNTVKNEMASIAIRIEQDTYQALREGNLAAYEAKLNSSSAYHDQILQLAKEGIEKNIKLTNDNFTINNIDIHFNRHPDAIDASDDTDLFDRYSYNFSIAVYDLDTDMLYYFEFDT